ncbi:retinaldehyde-binding protein 1-like [Chironomus tepperi]|uniref:retinaldehyde-binding protein 1-like n=1 Tax=Chironomus tepperi TaxID=113505 RepID=UPI00391F67D5
MSNISEEVLEKAKAEIREDETRKQQSVEQLRDFVTKHAFIKACRTDDRYLLPFLRARKYNMDRVCDTFEKALIFVRTHDDWFDFSEEKFNRIMELYDTGFLKVMKHRDSEGRRVVIANNSLDMEKYNADDVFRLHCLVFLILALEEETQICGIVYIDDFSTGITMKYLSMFPLKSMYDFTIQLKVTPVRLKNICLVGLPSFATQFLNIVKLGLSEVMNQRLHVVDNASELGNYVDQSVMTKDYGGKLDGDECLKEFRKIIDANIDIVKAFFDFELDMTKAEVLKDYHENIGSFRKLEID